MSFCTIKRNSEGKITRVNKPNGSESRVYNKIAKHPIVKNTEEAADLYKNIFIKEIESRAEDTQEFFSSVVTGENSKYIPLNTYEYDYTFSRPEESFRQDYQPRLGKFDKHISTSIPTFRDIQIKKGSAIVEMYSGKDILVYDLGGSEGGFVKSITSTSTGTIETINLEANEDMVNAHNFNPVENSQAIQEAFFEGFDNIPKHVPTNKAEVVHESMLFQFITPQRELFIDEIIENYMTKDGIFITEEKFQSANKEEYDTNERFKNENHKAKYFSKDQIKSKGDTVLVGMKENQAMLEDYISLLKRKFKYVEIYWSSGNFKGIIASDNKSKVDEFLNNLGDTTSEYSDTKYRDTDVTEVTPLQFKVAFDRAIQALKGLKNKLNLQLDNITLEDLKTIVKQGGKLFLTKDFQAGGFVQKDGYMGGLFKNPNTKKGNVSKVLQDIRLEAGGTFFDAYGTKLESIYIKNGFKPVARILFDEKQAIEGWDAPGSPLVNKPDVVFFIFSPNSNPKVGDGKVFDNYNEAKEFTLNSIEQSDIGIDNEIGIDFIHRLVGGRTVESYKKALSESNEGDTIEIGLDIDGEFKVLITIKKDTNKNNEQGFINNFIEAGIISEQRTKAGLEYRLEAFGETELSKIINSHLIYDEARAYLGSQSLTQDGFTVKLTKTKGIISLTTKSGTIIKVKKSEIDSMTFEELDSQYDNAIDIITQREWEAEKEAYRTEIPTSIEVTPSSSEAELQIKLLNFLSKLGVKTMSISEYIKNYTTRNGVAPSAKALADIANQVVAYMEGDVDSLSEEVAHFINEALPQDKVENVLRNIHKTAEWAEFSSYYRELYAQEYPEDELDNVVRREILGKIVAKVVAGKTVPDTSTETQKNIFQKVAEVINDFFDSIANFFRPEYSIELNQYLNEVEQLLSTEDITDLVSIDNFKHSTIRLYNVDNTNSPVNKLRKKATALAAQLQDSEKILMRVGSGSKSNAQTLKTVQNQLETALTVESITSLLSMVNSNVRAIKAAIKDSEDNNKSYFLSDEEQVVYQSVKHIAGKAVGEVQVLLKEIKKDTGTKEWDIVINEVDNTILGIQEVISKAELIDSSNVERLITKVMDSYHIPEQNRDIVEKWIEKADSDTNLFHATFGQLVHAKDGLLNLTGQVIKDMSNEAQVAYYNAMKDFQDRLKELGVSESEIGKEFVDGGYMLSEYDWNEFESQKNIIYVTTYKKALEASIARIGSGESVDKNNRLATLKSMVKLDTQGLLELKQANKLEELSSMEETDRKNLERPLISPLIERTMVDSYYEEYEKRLKSADISEVTKQRLSNYLSDVAAIKKKAYRKEGGTTILDYSSLTEADKIKLADLHKGRKMMKSYTDETGELKPGLKYIQSAGVLTTDERGNPIVGILDKSQLTDESKAALDLNKLDSQFTQENEEVSAKLFYDTIDRIDKEEGREAAIKFLEANAYTTLTQDFWDNLDSGNDIISRLKNRLKDSPELSNEINPLILNIRVFSFKIKNVIRIHSRKNNPSEVEVENMSSTARDSVKRLQKSLKEDIQKANQILGAREVSEKDEGLLSGVSEVNESYRKNLRELNLFEEDTDTAARSLEKAEEEIDFAKQHMTEENANLIESSKLAIHHFLIGSRANVNRSVEFILDNLSYSTEDLNDDIIRAEVLRTMIRSRVLPYYKRYTSETYTEYTEGLQTATKLSNYLQNSSQVKDAFIEINPNPTFFDVQDSEKLNPNYNKEFIGGYHQPKLSKFKNSKFSEKFGVISNGVSSKNSNLYQAYLATLDFNERTLEAMNVGEVHNSYLLPQIRKRKMERYLKGLKGSVVQNTKNFVKDTLAYTEDDMIQGDKVFGDDVKTIPRMYINKLEDPEDVSSDLFFALSIRGKEAFSRQSKIKYYGDLMSIHDKILTRDMNGKSQVASNTYKMVKSAIDFNLFGVKETATYPINLPFIGTVDLTKIARMLLNFIKFRNLGLNIVIPITSLLTGEVTRKIETFVGEFIDRRSQKLGTREYRRLAGDGMKEIGEINTEAKINVLGQFFKAFDMNDSFDNSNYGKFLRFLPRTGMVLHTAANYPLYGKTMLGILHDFRIVEGRMMNRNDFMKLKNSEGMSVSEAKTEWDAAEEKAMYGYLEHKGNKVTWNREALLRDLSEDGSTYTAEELDITIQDMFSKTQKYISLVNSMIDGQIPEEDRVLAQRHYLLSYFMTHRGWLSIAIARRFKNRHLNLDTNLTEEGSYRSFWNYMGSFAKEYKDSNFIKFVGSFKETWNTADELTRRNMRRVAIESGVLSTLMVFALALRTMADDDENEDLFALQLANYLSYRTLNELSSVQLNIGSNLAETIESPFVGWNTVKNLGSIGEVLSGEEVKHGSYRGMTKRRRYMTKMVPGMKQYFDLQNMNQTYETYKFYNTDNFSLTPANLLWMNTIDKKD